MQKTKRKMKSKERTRPLFRRRKDEEGDKVRRKRGIGGWGGMIFIGLWPLFAAQPHSAARKKKLKRQKIFHRCPALRPNVH
jgi:hypothetical protein